MGIIPSCELSFSSLLCQNSNKPPRTQYVRGGITGNPFANDEGRALAVRWCRGNCHGRSNTVSHFVCPISLSLVVTFFIFKWNHAGLRQTNCIASRKNFMNFVHTKLMILITVFKFQPFHEILKLSSSKM